MKQNVIGRKSARISRRSSVRPVKRTVPRPINGEIISLNQLTDRMRQGIHEHIALGTFTLEQLMVWYATDMRKRS